MFRLVCFVEDKELPKVLHAIAGLVSNMEPPQPVADQDTHKVAKPRATPSSNGVIGEISLKQGLINTISSYGAPFITTQDMRNWWVENGGKPTSMNSNLIQALVRRGLLTQSERGVYTINK